VTDYSREEDWTYFEFGVCARACVCVYVYVCVRVRVCNVVWVGSCIVCMHHACACASVCVCSLHMARASLERRYDELCRSKVDVEQRGVDGD